MLGSSSLRKSSPNSWSSSSNCSRHAQAVTIQAQAVDNTGLHIAYEADTCHALQAKELGVRLMMTAGGAAGKQAWRLTPLLNWGTNGDTHHTLALGD